MDKLRSPSAQRMAPIRLSEDSFEIGKVASEDRETRPGPKTPVVEQQIVRKEMNACIRDFIARLPENYRTVLVLSPTFFSRFMPNIQPKPAPKPPRRKRKSSRILRFVETKPYLRQEVVHRIGVEESRVTETITAEEMVAIVLLWCSYRPMVEVIQLISETIQARWFEGLEPAFYQNVEQIAHELDQLGLDRAASDLLKVGEVTAETVQDKTWAKRFHESIRQRVRKCIDDLPFLKQRTW